MELTLDALESLAVSGWRITLFPASIRYDSHEFGVWQGDWVTIPAEVTEAAKGGR